MIKIKTFKILKKRKNKHSTNIGIVFNFFFHLVGHLSPTEFLSGERKGSRTKRDTQWSVSDSEEPPRGDRKVGEKLGEGGRSAAALLGRGATYGWRSSELGTEAS